MYKQYFYGNSTVIAEKKIVKGKPRRSDSVCRTRGMNIGELSVTVPLSVTEIGLRLTVDGQKKEYEDLNPKFQAPNSK
jgi:hypothetical protein